MINVESTMVDIVVNSLEYIKVIVKLEEKYGIEFEDFALDYNYFPTIKSLADYIHPQIIK